MPLLWLPPPFLCPWHRCGCPKSGTQQHSPGRAPALSALLSIECHLVGEGQKWRYHDPFSAVGQLCRLPVQEAPCTILRSLHSVRDLSWLPGVKSTLSTSSSFTQWERRWERRRWLGSSSSDSDSMKAPVFTTETWQFLLAFWSPAPHQLT